MSFQTRVRLQGLVFTILIGVAATMVARPIDPVFAVVVGGGVFGCVFVVLITEWGGGDDAFASRIFARSPAAKFFKQIFEINPPPRKDWLAMRVCQKIVTEKLAALKSARDKLYREENERISGAITPEGVAKRIADNRELHAQIEVAKKAYAEAEWLADFFCFDTYIR